MPIATRSRISCRPWLLVISGALALLGCGGTPPAQASPEGAAQAAPQQPLAVGASAPDLVGTNADGSQQRLSQVKGEFAVVYFYPRDDTPGCTKEACAFRDAFDKYKAAGVTIFGVSRDSEESHRKFRQNHKLPFPLVADESGDVQRAYGVPSKMGVMAARVTFLVGRDGKVAHVWPEVDPGVHAVEVLAAVEARK
jgi:thioredoxin-dependent peroxiredoxin